MAILKIMSLISHQMMNILGFTNEDVEKLCHKQDEISKDGLKNGTTAIILAKISKCIVLVR